MFDNSQAAADVLKGMVGRNKEALAMVKALEKCGWNSRAFADALAQVGARYDENGFSFSVDVAHAVEKLIETYLGLMGGESPDPLADVFGTQEAADYLGLSYNSLKQYASRDNLLRGKIVGKTMIFHRSQLDAFKKSRKPVGNPNFGNED